jgi:UDP-N-acetylmuramyl pentapeptide phosphotransferase/UDP-N-acetylglucosamine-1-phosphate transferase
MEPILPAWLTLLLLAVVAAVFAASLFSHAKPNITWLERFKLGTIQIGTEERAKRTRRLRRIAGLEILLAAIVAIVIWVYWRSR